nr:hypothetical protein CFP56_17179 [Quercus suber]
MLRWSLKNNLIPCYDLLKSLLFENEKVITALGCSRRALLSNGTKTMVPNIALLREVGAPPSTISYLVTRSPSVAFIKPNEKITKVMNFVVNKLGRPSTDILMNPVVLNLSLEKRIIPRCSVVQILLAKNLIKSDFGLATFLLRKEKFFLEKFVIKFQDNVPQLLSVYQTKMDLLDVEIQSEKDDDDDISGDEDMSFGSAEDDDEPEETPKKVESSKKRPSESATKTLVPAKKAKAATP